MRRTINRHEHYLDELINRLDEIGESREDIQWMMKNGIWTPNNQTEYHKMPDLICVYEGYAVPIELKGTSNKRNKALLQLRSGREFIQSALRMTIPYGVFVVYSDNGYKSEQIDLMELR